VKSLVFWLVSTLVGLGQSDVSGAFERRQFRVHGYVQWIAGEKLMVLADNGAPIAIDLTRSRAERVPGSNEYPSLDSCQSGLRRLRTARAHVGVGRPPSRPNSLAPTDSRNTRKPDTPAHPHRERDESPPVTRLGYAATGRAVVGVTGRHARCLLGRTGPMDRGRRQVAQCCPWDPKALGRLLGNPRRG
jgi:hypothetical protein